jgi:hypothetical protein
MSDIRIPLDEYNLLNKESLDLRSQIAAKNAEIARLTSAAKASLPLLEKLGSGVFNDNGDMTISPPVNRLDFDDYQAAYWAAKRIISALKAPPK